MGHRFMDIVFTPGVKAEQARQGSRDAYADMEAAGDRNGTLGPREREYLAARDSVYLATVSETGWPYVQHRGGPPGFLRVLDDRTLGFADFRGNRQYVSVGNLRHDDRVAMFCMDYAQRRRLKLLGRVRTVGPDAPDLLARLTVPGYAATVERGIVITVEGFDWNCPQHITPRWTQAELPALLGPLEQRLAAIAAENDWLRAENARLRSATGGPA